MDPHLLAQVLSQTFLSDTSLRHQAELQLSQLEPQPGYPSTLLHITVLPTLPFPIKQAAILRLKHLIERHWDPPAPPSPSSSTPNPAFSSSPSPSPSPPSSITLSPTDRHLIRDNLFESIVTHHSTPLIRVQLLQCMKPVIRADWPTQWPHLLPTLLSALSSPSTSPPPRVYAALLSLCLLYKRWVFVEAKRRDDPIDALTRDAFPPLLPIFQALSTADTVEAHEALRVVCRIVFLATQMRLPLYLRSPAHASPFLTLLIHTITRPIPPALLTAYQSTNPSTSSPHSYPLARAQRWAMNALTRIFSRWGQPLSVKDKALKPFATYFSSKVALPTFTAVLSILHRQRDGGYTPPKLSQLCYVYLSNALKLQSLRRLMQDNLTFLIEQAILPVLCLTTDDVQLFVHDPHEFIRQSLDLMEEYHDPRVAACNFLLDLVQVDARRHSNAALQTALALITRIFHDTATHPTDERGIIIKEGAMRMLGALRQVLIKDEAHYPTIERLLTTGVLPELSSPHGFVRSRAISLLGRYSKLPWQGKAAQADAIRFICQNLQPPNALPVRLESAAAVSRLVRDEAVMEWLKPQIPLIFATFFALMDEIGNEEVISTLQALLGQVGEDVEPYAAEVVTRLTTMCLTLLHSPEEDDESRLAASEALRTISAVLYALGPKPAVITAVESVTYPLIERVVLNAEGAEDFEDGLELIHCIIDHSSHVSPFMWRIFPRIVAAFSTYASDHLQQIAAVTDLYTALGGEAFAAGSAIVQGDEEGRSGLDVVVRLVLDVWRGGEQGPKGDEQEIHQQYACKMLESILAHHKGRVDHLVPLLLRLTTTLLLALTALPDKKAHTSLILSLLDVVAALTLYHPPTLLHLLTSTSLLQPVFNVWMSYVDSDAITHSFHHQRMAMLALSTLTALPFATLPPLLRSAMPDVITLQVKRLAGMVELYRQVEEEERDEEGKDEEGDDDDEYEGGLFDEDEVEEGGEEGEGKEEAMGEGEGEEGEEEATEEEQLAKWEELVKEHDQNEVDEAHFPTPLDDVDEFVHFAAALQQLQQQEPAFYAKYLHSVQKEKKIAQAYQAVLDKAEEQKKKMEEEAEEGEEEEEEAQTNGIHS